MTLKPKPNHSNESGQKSQDRKKACQTRSNLKVLLTIFFDCNGVVHHKFLPQGHTVNKEYYLEVMHRLCKVINLKSTELRKNQSWILHHDNAPAHTTMLVPCSPDLVKGLFLFPKLKTPVKGKRFATIEGIKEKSKQEQGLEKMLA